MSGLAKSAGEYPAGFLPDETSTRSFQPPDKDQAFGGIAAAQTSAE
jgi:hypothetical protein